MNAAAHLLGSSFQKLYLLLRTESLTNCRELGNNRTPDTFAPDDPPILTWDAVSQWPKDWACLREGRYCHQ